jgi:hypothetical protein
MHGGKNPGPPLGNRNAVTHGRFTAESIEERRKQAVARRRAKELVKLAVGQADAFLAASRKTARKRKR